MENSTLKFHQTVSVNKFKEGTESEVITIIRNPKTDKIFFSTDSGTKGAVSPDYKENPVVSEVEGDNGEVFWLLHKQATQNVIDTL